MQNFKFYDKKDILFFTNLRKFETKLGEVVDYVTNINKWKAEIESDREA